MSLVDELAGVLHEMETCAEWVAYYDPAKITAEEWAKLHHSWHVSRETGPFIAALAARGIDLELAYQWSRALGALPNQRDHRLWRYGTWRMQTRGPWAINGVTWQAIAEPHNATGVGDDHEIEALGPTPAAALSALADALEARE